MTEGAKPDMILWRGQQAFQQLGFGRSNRSQDFGMLILALLGGTGHTTEPPCAPGRWGVGGGTASAAEGAVRIHQGHTKTF